MKLSALLLILLFSAARAEEQRQVNIYNWADYIGRHTVEEFEKKTGIKVVYDTFASDAELEAKIITGESGYDIVVTSTDYFGRQIAAGVYQKLDKSRLPNWKNLDPHILDIESEFDPGNLYAMPYLRGVSGFTYNVDMIRARMPDAPVDSLDMLFKPEIVSKFADCGVSFADSAEDVFQLALNYLHLDPNTTRRQDYEAAEKLLLSVRPYIRTFDSEEYLNGLPNREVCLVMSWSGDYSVAKSRARAAGIAVNLAFTVPKEGSNEWADAMLIPKGAPHAEEAHEFLNFMMDPKVIAEVSNDIRYGNDNAAATPLVDPELTRDPAIYPTPELEKRLYPSRQVSPTTERLRTRLWTRIKSGL